jgi:hypothetical protein
MSAANDRIRQQLGWDLIDAQRHHTAPAAHDHQQQPPVLPSKDDVDTALRNGVLLGLVDSEGGETD